MSPAPHPSDDRSDDQLDAASWCRHLIPDRSVYAFLADHRHELFPPELFADLVVQGRSHPSVPTEVVATVMVLQALEGLSDREAISALRRDIAWKVACGLRLDDEGFHPTVLVYWRNRIRRSSRPRRIFEAVRQVVQATGVLAGRSRRVLDSTILTDAVATQATLSVAVAVGLWWLYFDMASLAAEHRLLQARGQARVDLAVEAYTYGHLPLVAGIVLAALGIEGVLAHAGEREPLGAFYALPLFGGVALYLAGQLLFKRRMHNALSVPRLLAAGVLLAALPAAVVLPPLAGLAGLVVILAALIVVETTRYAPVRRSLRNA
jgi:hypothetical protein